MAYCVINDVYLVGVHGGTTYTATSIPNTTQVTSIIEQVYNEINSRFYSSGINVPIVEADSPFAYALVKQLNALGAAVFAETLIWNERESKTPDDSKNPISNITKKYYDLLKYYCDAPKRLIDASLTNNYCILDTVDNGVIWSGTAEKYDYDYMDQKIEGDIKPYFRQDDEW